MYNEIVMNANKCYVQCTNCRKSFINAKMFTKRYENVHDTEFILCPECAKELAKEIVDCYMTDTNGLSSAT